MDSNLAFTLEKRPRGFKPHSLGKTLRLYRGDKEGKVDFVSRGGIFAGNNGEAYIDYVKFLLELPNTNSPDLFLELIKFFPDSYAQYINSYKNDIVNGDYKSWCDFFIELHTSKTQLDPFISASSCYQDAENYSEQEDEITYHFKIKAARVLNDRFNRGNTNGTEFFILGAVTANEIIV